MKLFERIGVLSRYLAQQNLFLIFTCLGAGTGIYLLSDLFDRLDDFLEAGLGLGVILKYFLVKVPLIFSQILPAVFLIAAIVQLGLLARNRELLALRAGGLSMVWFVRFFVAYGVIWSCGQLLFSQVVGVYGEREAGRIWKEDVRKRQMDRRIQYNLWFRQGHFVVECGEAMPGRNQARYVTIYEFAEDDQSLMRVITAQSAEAGTHSWTLRDVLEFDPNQFSSQRHAALAVPLEQDLRVYQAVDPEIAPAQLPLWQLSTVISQLRKSGSNVERLVTVWHSKWAYAFSILTMAMIALTLATFSENVYANVGVGLGVTFLFYGANVLGASMGEKGLAPPMVAAWLGNIIFTLLGGIRLAWVCFPDVARKITKKLRLPQ